MGRIIVSASTSFVILGGGALLLALWSAKGQALDATTYLAALLMGAIAAAKDVRSFMRLPPLTNGNGDMLNRFAKEIATQGTASQNENKQND